MVQCERCGRLYDYEKYNGICPECARYNRKENSADADRRMHLRYDGNPRTHEADSSHREAHRVNQDNYRHATDPYDPFHESVTGRFAGQERSAGNGTFAGQSRGAGSRAREPKSPKKMNPFTRATFATVVAIILIIVIGIIVFMGSFGA